MTYQDLQSYKFDIPTKKNKLYKIFYFFIDNILIKPSPKFLFEYRNIIYRIFGAKIGVGVKINSSSKLFYPWNIIIGDYSWIGDNCTLYSIDKITIGSNVAIAHNVFINTATHDIQNINFKTLTKPVLICDQTWIASNSFINMNVTINKGVVIGACSFVTSDLPEGYICFGSPAKPIKLRNK
jgi:putative colanic acid biosynthesis acetyltransferase WcaF